MSVHSEAAKVCGATPAAVSCTGKVAFANYSQASRVLTRYQTKDRPGRSAYLCGHCGMWHIGTDQGHVKKHKAKDFKDQKYHE
jgi:hypothetical protein